MFIGCLFQLQLLIKIKLFNGHYSELIGLNSSDLGNNRLLYSIWKCIIYLLHVSDISVHSDIMHFQHWHHSCNSSLNWRFTVLASKEYGLNLIEHSFSYHMKAAGRHMPAFRPLSSIFIVMCNYHHKSGWNETRYTSTLISTTWLWTGFSAFVQEQVWFPFKPRWWQNSEMVVEWGHLLK